MLNKERVLSQLHKNNCTLLSVWQNIFIRDWIPSQAVFVAWFDVVFIYSTCKTKSAEFLHHLHIIATFINYSGFVSPLPRERCEWRHTMGVVLSLRGLRPEANPAQQVLSDT